MRLKKILWATGLFLLLMTAALSAQSDYNVYIESDTEGNRYLNLTDEILKPNNRTNKNVFLTDDADWTTSVNQYTGIQNGYYTIDGGGHTVTLKQSTGIGIGAKIILKNITVDMQGFRFTIRDEGHLELGEGATLINGNNATAGAVSVEGNSESKFVMKAGSKIKDTGADSQVANVIYVHSGGSLIFEGGTIETVNKEKPAVLLNDTSGKIEVSGDFNLTAGISGARCDISLKGENQFTLKGAFTGSVTLNAAEVGKPFGKYDADAEGFSNLLCYGKSDAVCVAENGNLIWATDGDCAINDDKYGRVSLSEAIKKAPSGSTIYLLRDVTLTETLVMDRIGAELTIDGAYDGGMRKISFPIDSSENLATANKRILLIRNGHVTLNNVFLSGGMHKDYGGSVIIEEASCSLTLSGKSVIEGAKATNGGAVWVRHGTLTVNDEAEIKGNSATSHGGAIYLTTEGKIYLNGGKITENYAPGSGGIYALSGTKLYLDKKAYVFGNTNNKETKAQSNIVPENGEIVSLSGTFEGLAGVSCLGEGDAFGIYVSGKGEENICSDNDQGLSGYVKDGKMIWLRGKLRFSTEADTGIYEKDGGAKSGVIRFITAFDVAKDAEILSYGTYVLPTSLFEENKKDILTNTEEALGAYYLSRKTGDADFTAPYTGYSFGVDYCEIPKEYFYTEFNAVSFVNIGGKYYFSYLSNVSVNSVKNGEDGSVKVLDD